MLRLASCIWSGFVCKFWCAFKVCQLLVVVIWSISSGETGNRLQQSSCRKTFGNTIFISRAGRVFATEKMSLGSYERRCRRCNLQGSLDQSTAKAPWLLTWTDSLCVCDRSCPTRIMRGSAVLPSFDSIARIFQSIAYLGFWNTTVHLHQVLRKDWCGTVQKKKTHHDASLVLVECHCSRIANEACAEYPNQQVRGQKGREMYSLVYFARLGQVITPFVHH